MTEITPAYGTTVFQIIVNGEPQDIVATFKDGMERIGFRVAGSLEAMKPWKSIAEFPGLDTQPLAGSYFHRIRYAALNHDEHLEIAEHVIKGFVDSSSQIRTISLSECFDPGFDLQVALNKVALGLETISSASSKLEDILEGKVEFLRLSMNDADIIKEAHEMQRLFGGEDFLGDYQPHGPEFLDNLPSIVRARFDELAAESFPASAMTI